MALVSSSAGDDIGERPPKRVKRSYVACRRCHAHKIKCSGGHPCENCEAAKTPEQCEYPSRDRKVTVTESYLKKLQAENAAFKAASSTVSLHPSSGDATQADGDVQNPLFETPVRPAQSNTHAKQTTFAGEAACTAFGNQLLFCLGGEDVRPSSTRDREYVKDDRFNRLSKSDYQLPDRIQANLLVRVALRFIGSDYHQFQIKPFLDKLDQVYKSRRDGEDRVWICKLFVVLALGELYANRSQQEPKIDTSVPGTEYFLTAIGLLQDLHEEASVQQVEVLLLLSFYSNALGRTNSAYVYSGIALRLSLTLGLHRSKHKEQIENLADYENGLRVWWTVYVFDRLSSSRLGHPITIHDDDIDVPLPSSAHLEPADREKFTSPEHLCANIKLARITGEILHQIYGLPRSNAQSFVSNVRQILTSLRTWDKYLPESLRWRHNSPRPVASLHLHFNLCIMQTTRPILLYIFKLRNPLAARDVSTQAATNTSSSKTSLDASAPTQTSPTISPTTLALSEACVQAARASNSILTQCFIENSLAVYGYFDSHYLFSSTLILIMSAVMDPNPIDSDAVQTALSLLQTMRNHGNVCAKGYYDRLNQIKSRIAQLRSAMIHKDSTSTVDHAAATTARGTLTQQREDATNQDVPTNSNPQDAASRLTLQSEIALSEEPWSLFPFTEDSLQSRADWPSDYLLADLATDPLDNPFIRDFLNTSGQSQSGEMGVWSNTGAGVMANSTMQNNMRTEEADFGINFDDGFMQF